MRSSDCAKVAVREGVADVFKLRVVKGVEGFRSEFETAAARLTEHKALEERYVPVLATGAIYGVAWHVAEFSGECRREG